ncbi:MAG: helix-turn-helix transcriptional regulator [Prevotellaceae bacterium]|jgi:putative transcriptional regulator|nr:helix-turn-helix transcriptional regulator [Prevotellaceae bacterium]
MKNTIKIERARYNLSQQELADKLGITRQSIYAIEAGKFIPSTLLALKMAKLFNAKVEEIFSLEEKDNND